MFVLKELSTYIQGSKFERYSYKEVSWSTFMEIFTIEIISLSQGFMASGTTRMTC